MRRRSFTALIIACLINSFSSPISSAYGQTDSVSYYPGASLRFEHLTLDDGLSQNAGLVTMQDSHGYLWFGTQDGLNRYDGKSFTIFKTDPNGSTSISHNSVISLLEDNDGSIWVGTWGGGLNRFDPKTEKFTRYLQKADNSDSPANTIVTSLAQDASGQLWVGTLRGLELFDQVTGQFTHFQNNPENPSTLSSDAISAILPAPDGKLWIGTGAYTIPGAGLNRFDPATGKAEHVGSNGECLKGQNISVLSFDGAGNLWIGSGGYSLPGNGVDRLNIATGQCEHFNLGQSSDAALAANNVLDLLIDRSGQLWVATHGGGLVRMNARSPGDFTIYRHDPANPSSISNDTLFSVFQDRTGVLWVGSLNSGLNKLNLNNLVFRLYESNPNNSESLASNLIGAFAETPDGKIWIGTWETGLERFDRTTGHFEHFPHDPADPDSLASNLVMSVLAESDGSLWVGMLGAGLDHFDPARGKAVHFINDPANPNSLVDDNVVALIKDALGRLWIGTMNGLDRFDPLTNKFIHYRNDPAIPDSLSVNAAVSFLLDGDMLLVGTWGGGLNQINLAEPASLDPKTAFFERLRHDPQDPRSLGDDGVWAMLKAKDGVLWLGTQGGLDRFDTKTGTFKTYREKDGLRNSTILGVLEDGRGDLWLPTNNGLARFDPFKETFTIFDRSEGLQGNEFNSNAYFKSTSGEMFIGGSHGFNVFDPKQIKPNPVSPPVVITGFKIFNSPVAMDLSGKSSIKLNYDQNFIAFEFAALDFQAPQKNQYAYKMDGFDKDWVEAGTRNYANYTNLPGGEYTFHVRAANSDGVWNETGVSLSLSVTPPIWQTWEFQGALALGLVVLIVLGTQWRLRAAREQNIKLEAMLLEQRRVEAELRESDARFRAMYDNTAVGMAMMSLDRKLISVNQAAARITGYSIEELVNTDPTRLSHPDDLEIGRDHFLDLTSGKISGFQMEKRFVRKNQATFWGRVTYSIVPDKDGKPEYLIGIIEDVTEEVVSNEKLGAQEAEYRRTLEQRVTERTQELANTNLRLVEEIEQRKRAEQALAIKAAEDAVTAERTRLARDLHDAVTQTLFAASLIAEVLPELWATQVSEAQQSTEELRQLTRGALAEMRTLLLELRPSALAQSRMGDLIRQLCEALIGRARLPIHLVIDGDRGLPPEVQVAIYRIAQESLNNVFKYARATQVNVSLSMPPGGVHLNICDNGIGFDMTTKKSTSLGLRIMRERAEAIGAQLSISSKPGEGVCVDVEWVEKPNMKLSVFKK